MKHEAAHLCFIHTAHKMVLHGDFLLLAGVLGY
jgi:hypothetical protein